MKQCMKGISFPISPWPITTALTTMMFAPFAFFMALTLRTVAVSRVKISPPQP